MSAKKAAGAGKRPARQATSRQAASNKSRNQQGQIAKEKAAAPEAVTQRGPSRESDGPSFPVVAVGASAGGLEATTELFQHLPAKTGMALIFVQHLDPHHKSNLVEILARCTEMPIQEITDGMRLQPNHIYITPPDKEIAVLHGVLHLMSRTEGPGRHMPIDYCFRSLAQDLGLRAVGVVLSGMGSDGAAGLRAIKAEGGITFAQSSESAKYSGMPLSAAATGIVDFVLTPKAIAEELLRIGQHPYVGGVRPRPAGESLFGDTPDALHKVFILLRKASGVDFSQYKQSTVERRLSRRMVLHKIESLKQYVRYLEQNAAEVHALFEDMLINVTEFFREPEAFQALKDKIFPRILQDRTVETPIRIWVPACSTGEEAYSVAITLLECLDGSAVPPTIQIFATDVSESAIERARTGKYLENIDENVSPERLRRFFIKTGQGYQISKTIRDMCIFARQNVVKDPPFSNLDLVTCRNLLIYMGTSLQRRLIPTFHYALKPTGFLMLGHSETVGGFSDLFAMVDRVHKIYSKKPAVVRLPMDVIDSEFRPHAPPAVRPAAPAPRAEFDLQKETDRILLSRFTPPGVVINSEYEIFLFRGQTGRFLEPAQGAASLNLLRMAREGLALDLRATVHKATQKRASVRKEGLQCRYNGHHLHLNLEVVPLLVGQTDELYFVVLFEEVAPPPAESKEAAAKPGGRSARAKQAKEKQAKDSEKEAQRMRDELAQTKETLQHIIEEHETTNEELRAANEEIQSANEELQSTNEELETAKEELQSTNEELTTLNAELESQNHELNQAINDLNNLHNSINIPVVLLGTDLRIRSFTPPAERSLRLIPADSGRPINELKLGIEVQDLDRKVHEVIETLNTYEEEVRAFDGHWYLMRVRPYRTTDNKIIGAVLALVDVNERKVAEEELRGAKVFAESVVATVREPLLVLNAQMQVQLANPAFYRLFHVLPKETEGRKLCELGNGQWDVPELRKLLDEVIPRNAVVEDFEVKHEFPKIGRRRFLLNARRMDGQDNQPRMILLAMEDCTG